MPYYRIATVDAERFPPHTARYVRAEKDVHGVIQEDYPLRHGEGLSNSKCAYRRTGCALQRNGRKNKQEFIDFVLGKFP